MLDCAFTELLSSASAAASASFGMVPGVAGMTSSSSKKSIALARPMKVVSIAGVRGRLGGGGSGCCCCFLFLGAGVCAVTSRPDRRVFVGEGGGEASGERGGASSPSGSGDPLAASCSIFRYCKSVKLFPEASRIL